MWISRSAPRKRLSRLLSIAAAVLLLLFTLVGAVLVWLLWGAGDLIPYPDGPPPGPTAPASQATS